MKVILLMAVSLDGLIARDQSHPVDWTEKKDKELFVEITKKAGCIIMGSKTYDTIGKPLPDRKNIIMTRKKKRVSNDPALCFTSDPPIKIIENLKKEGFKEVILIGGSIVNTLFAKEKLINEIVLTTAPVFFGRGLTIFNEDLDLELELINTNRLGENSVLLEYKIIY